MNIHECTVPVCEVWSTSPLTDVAPSDPLDKLSNADGLASSSLLNNNGSQNLKKTSGRPKGPYGLGTKPSHSNSGFFLLISQAASHEHM